MAQVWGITHSLFCISLDTVFYSGSVALVALLTVILSSQRCANYDEAVPFAVDPIAPGHYISKLYLAIGTMHVSTAPISGLGVALCLIGLSRFC